MPRTSRRLTRREPGSPFWWADFTVNGDRLRRSTKVEARPETRDQAELVADGWRTERLLARATGAKPRMTLEIAFGRYWLEHAQGLPSAYNIEYQSDIVLGLLGRQTGLHELTPAMVSGMVAKRRGQFIRSKCKPENRRLVSNTTVNKDLTLLRSVVNRARTTWGVEAAEIDWKSQWLPEPQARDRYLTHEEADRLVSVAAKHLRPALEFSLMIGVRLSNCIRLDWRQIDFQGRRITFRIKSRKPGGETHVIEIFPALLVLLANLGPKDRGPVFTYKGKPLGSFRTAWATALRKAGIEDCRWHDLRHTAASWMVQRGVPLGLVQKILGHKSIATTNRYAHHAPGEAAKAMAESWAGFRQSAETADEQPVEAETKLVKR